MFSSDYKGSSGYRQLWIAGWLCLYFFLVSYGLLFLLFFSLCNLFVQPHVLWRLSELMGFEQWERLWVCVFFWKSIQWRILLMGRIERELCRQDLSITHSDSHVVFLTVLSRAWCLRRRSIRGHRYWKDTWKSCYLSLGGELIQCSTKC